MSRVFYTRQLFPIIEMQAASIISLIPFICDSLNSAGYVKAPVTSQGLPFPIFDFLISPYNERG